MQSPIDRTGHVFIDYNPAYNGVVILAPTTASFEDFVLPTPELYDQGRFYGAEALDTDGDGIYEVEVTRNDCIPHCAGGTHTTEIYRSNGHDYVTG